MFKRFQKEKINQQKEKTLPDILKTFYKSADFVSFRVFDESPFYLHYLESVVEERYVHDEVLPYVQRKDMHTLMDLQRVIPLEETKILRKGYLIEEHLLRGHIIIQKTGENDEVLSLPAELIEERAVEAPENEFTVIGPNESFIESIDVNLNLVRKRLHTSALVVEELKVGRLSQSRLTILYIEGITSPQLVQTLRQRIQDIDYDEIVDISQINQFISDHPNSHIPQLLETERPERVTSALAEGKVAFLMDGSPHATLGPTNFMEFFSSPDDHYMLWPLGSAFRLIRIVALLFSVHATSFYIAVTSYQQELIPDELLDTLIASRIEVPYPPIVEVLILELTVELLREAGARLPSRIAQTIGIVGGIVIGTAVVEASLASSVLLIMIGITALASFTAPIYKMGNTIRLIRFPFILFAQWFGIFGMVFCSLLYLSHLFKLTSLGYPYLAPLYPLRVKDLRDVIFKMPIQKQQKRPSVLRPQKRKRFDVKQRKTIPKDIEE
ncbi:spore germination protein [Salicibibacter halophilus]|uniref:Spore germination protein n=1 Tax=Salicibibacter halophilus TaxID=2502791 RepID=A0A514LKA9_9BACI|nr:spore germination protein [Salicibibacter halophilus]QDI92290.1 spore germination protein [Salicibibacter halophilus]